MMKDSNGGIHQQQEEEEEEEIKKKKRVYRGSTLVPTLFAKSLSMLEFLG